MILERIMLHAEEVAISVHRLLTRTPRAIVRQLTIAPRRQGKA